MVKGENILQRTSPIAVPKVIAFAKRTRRVAKTATVAMLRPSSAVETFSGLTDLIKTWTRRAARSRAFSSSTSAIPSRLASIYNRQQKNLVS